MDGNWLLLETSDRAQAGLAVEGLLVDTFALPKGREQNRELVPAVNSLLERQGMKPGDLTGIALGLGPGSYTGLRIGLMLGKTLAYATGCEFRAVPTFPILASMVKDADEVDVIADALKQTVYVQRFLRNQALNALRAEKLSEWVRTLKAESAVTGPGLELHAAALPAGVRAVPVATGAILAALLTTARAYPALSREELFAVEPLYVRGSSAEEKAKEQAQG